MSSRLAIALAGSLLLAGCGERADLRPAAARSLPAAPYGRPDQPAPRELLGQTPQARPVNSVELRTKSEPRGDDPFNLPPKD